MAQAAEALQEPFPVIQADRDAGVLHVLASSAPDREAMADRMKAGGMDDCPLVQSIARIRIHGWPSPPPAGPQSAIGLLQLLAEAEADYRHAHDVHGGGHTTTGRAWDRMRRAGDQARAYLDQQVQS